MFYTLEYLLAFVLISLTKRFVPIRVIKRLILLFFLIPYLGLAQSNSALWEGYFSFSRIVDVSNSSEKIYAAAENAVFSYELNTNIIEKITTVEGLAGENITNILYSEDFATLLIGYDNGLMELYFEDTKEVLSVVDIVERQNIAPNSKRINHFFENDGRIYISTNYGISVYDLDRLEFGDTYFIGNGGTQITVKQTTIINNQIYAACQDNNGIKLASLDDPNLIDFGQWEILVPGNFQTINAVNTNVYAVATNRNIFKVFPGNPSILTSLPELPLDSEVSESNLVLTTSEVTYLYDENLNLVQSFEPNDMFQTTFNAATVIANSIYIGTEGFGLLNTLISQPAEFSSILPNGPLKNNVFRVDAQTETLWATFGAFSEDLNPFPLNSEGISYLNDTEWTNIPFDSLLGARELNKITPNPFNPNQVFISSFKDGILELNNFEPTILFDDTNSGLESLILPGNPNFKGFRVSGSEFDRSGLLWSLTSRIERPLKSYDPATGSWRSYSFSDLIDDPLNDELGFVDLQIDNNGTKWIGSFTNGLIAYNENNQGEPLKNLNSEEQNLPFQRVSAIALDNRNQLWVGTTFGLRVLFNTTNFFQDPNPTLSTIVILENGIPTELLEDQSITDIKVDGSNNKWVGTADSGVFYFSPDGQTTIYHFTTDNSPLPSDGINDIAIDQSNGKVYIATTRGLVSFLAGGSAPEQNLEEAYVYPNPVRPDYNILGFNDLNDITKGVKIMGLTDNVNIKITDIEGNLVAEAQSRVNLRSSNANYNFAIDGGTAIWNGKNLANNVVASGVYVILISDLDTFETKVLKLLIVR